MEVKLAIGQAVHMGFTLGMVAMQRIHSVPMPDQDQLGDFMEKCLAGDNPNLKEAAQLVVYFIENAPKNTNGTQH